MLWASKKIRQAATFGICMTDLGEPSILPFTPMSLSNVLSGPHIGRGPGSTLGMSPSLWPRVAALSCVSTPAKGTRSSLAYTIKGVSFVPRVRLPTQVRCATGSPQLYMLRWRTRLFRESGKFSNVERSSVHCLAVGFSVVVGFCLPIRVYRVGENSFFQVRQNFAKHFDKTTCLRLLGCWRGSEGWNMRCAHLTEFRSERKCRRMELETCLHACMSRSLFIARLVAAIPMPVFKRFEDEQVLQRNRTTRFADGLSRWTGFAAKPYHPLAARVPYC